MKYWKFFKLKFKNLISKLNQAKKKGWKITFLIEKLQQQMRTEAFKYISNIAVNHCVVSKQSIWQYCLLSVVQLTTMDCLAIEERVKKNYKNYLKKVTFLRR